MTESQCDRANAATGPPPSAAAPKVSIVLPTFNRAAFLPDALTNVAGQTFTDWELIIVDDGSTDDTATVITGLAATMPRPVRYIRRPNGGPGAARQTGIAHARGAMLAFFDSDDLWLDHHLADSVAALDANRDVDWVFSSTRVVDRASGDVLQADVFQPWEEHPMLRLRTRQRGGLRIIDDPDPVAALLEGHVMSGFQVSVIRRRVFDRVTVPALYVGEDLAFAGLAMQCGVRLAWLNAVHVVRQIHGGNVSNVGGGDVDRQARVQRRYGHALRYLRRHSRCSDALRRQMTRTIARHGFWRVGYVTLWHAGRERQALRHMRLALRRWPWSRRCWKTYLVCRAMRLARQTRRVLRVIAPWPFNGLTPRRWTTTA